MISCSSDTAEFASCPPRELATSGLASISLTASSSPSSVRQNLLERGLLNKQ